MSTSRVALALGRLLSRSAAALPVEAHRRCHLVIDHDYIARVIDPVLRQHLGTAYPFYDAFHPGIVRGRKTMELLYDPDRSVNGGSLMSETTLIIKVDACTGEVRSAYDALPP
jgi:hypothetical protein